MKSSINNATKIICSNVHVICDTLIIIIALRSWVCWLSFLFWLQYHEFGVFWQHTLGAFGGIFMIKELKLKDLQEKVNYFFLSLRIFFV
jgi:hypothetical protein